MARSEKMTFRGSLGDDLAARLDLPSGDPVAYALFAHCFTCSKDVFAASRISRALTEYGVAVLRFDFTGLGSSEGDFANTNFSSNVADLVRAADRLREQREAPKLLIGHSLGGAAVLAAAPSVPESLGVVTIGAPCDPSHVSHLFSDSIEAIRTRGEGSVTIGGRSFLIRRQFLDDIAEQRLTASIGSLGKALLVMHSPRDEVVGIDEARCIFEAASHPRSFVSLDEADHLLTEHRDAVYVADVLAAWSTRYLAPGAQAREVRAERGVVRVRQAAGDTLTQQITAGPHTMVADEPPGTGDDRGPTPYDLLLAALGACTSMTLRMYADRKRWPLDGVAVTLTYDRQHAPDSQDPESRDSYLHRFVRVVELTGDLDATQRHRLREIADRCPVHRTLMERTEVVTRLAG